MDKTPLVPLFNLFLGAVIIGFGCLNIPSCVDGLQTPRKALFNWFCLGFVLAVGVRTLFGYG